MGLGKLRAPAKSQPAARRTTFRRRRRWRRRRSTARRRRPPRPVTAPVPSVSFPHKPALPKSVPLSSSDRDFNLDDAEDSEEELISDASAASSEGDWEEDWEDDDWEEDWEDAKEETSSRRRSLLLRSQPSSSSSSKPSLKRKRKANDSLPSSPSSSSDDDDDADSVDAVDDSNGDDGEWEPKARRVSHGRQISTQNRNAVDSNTNDYGDGAWEEKAPRNLRNHVPETGTAENFRQTRNRRNRVSEMEPPQNSRETRNQRNNVPETGPLENSPQTRSGKGWELLSRDDENDIRKRKGKAKLEDDGKEDLGKCKGKRRGGTLRIQDRTALDAEGEEDIKKKNGKAEGNSNKGKEKMDAGNEDGIGRRKGTVKLEETVEGENGNRIVRIRGTVKLEENLEGENDDDIMKIKRMVKLEETLEGENEDDIAKIKGMVKLEETFEGESEDDFMKIKKMVKLEETVEGENEVDIKKVKKRVKLEDDVSGNSSRGKEKKIDEIKDDIGKNKGRVNSEDNNKGDSSKGKETIDELVPIQDKKTLEVEVKDDMKWKIKGKEKVEDEVEQNTEQEPSSNADVCGVCLSEGGQMERGKLDCCDHFFCYTCIMEWAKVESRCPLCKQRFVTIVRPPSSGNGRMRTVRIPTRNQVYIPPENEIVADPFSDVVCMECHEAGEERLLLLCDQCDSAAHTYCVGLGRSVPRGDWFCRNCQASIAETPVGLDDEDFILGFSDEDEETLLRSIVANRNPGNRHMSQRRARTADRMSSSSTGTRRARSNTRRRLRIRLISRRNNTGGGSALPRLSRMPRVSARRAAMDAPPPHVAVARTVPQQRRLQERIQVMRDEWEGIRRGTAPFPLTVLGSPPPVNDQTVGSLLDPHQDLIEPLGISTSTFIVTEDGINCREALDRAWAMMEKARSLRAQRDTDGGLHKPGTQRSSSLSNRDIVESEQCAQNPRSVLSMNLDCDASKSSTSETVLIKDGSSHCLENTDMNQQCISDHLSMLPLNVVTLTREDEIAAASNVGDRQSVEVSNGLIGRMPLMQAEQDTQSKEDTLTTITVQCESSEAHCLPPAMIWPSKNISEALSLPGNTNVEHVSAHKREREEAYVADPSCIHASDCEKSYLPPKGGLQIGVADHESKSLGRAVVKDKVANMVKAELWPSYLEGLDKKQFKEIARSATHILLAALGLGDEKGRPSNDTFQFCKHTHLHAQSVVSGCCNACLKEQVRGAVLSAKNKSLGPSI